MADVFDKEVTLNILRGISCGSVLHDFHTKLEECFSPKDGSLYYTAPLSAFTYEHQGIGRTARQLQYLRNSVALGTKVEVNNM
jgi:hypothetical protein